MRECDRPFSSKVPVRDGRAMRMIGSAREAADLLLFGWPDGPETKKRRAARSACLCVLQGIADPSDARAALVAAAEERGILAGSAATG